MSKKLNNRRLANKLFIYMAASAVPKSGDRETRKTYESRAEITDSMHDQGKPRECVVHIPLHERFKSLLKCPQYCEAVRWENCRPQGNDDYITGKYYYIILYICSLIVFIH